MRAIVLVGGQGTRLRPLTYSVPKPMLPVAGKPMIAHTIEWLGRHGIDEVVFSLGYRPDAFTTAFPDAVWAGVKLVYAVEPEPLDTAGAIRFAAAAVGALNERLVVVNGDILTDLDVTALVAFHDRSGAEGTIHLTPVASWSSSTSPRLVPPRRISSTVAPTCSRGPRWRASILATRSPSSVRFSRRWSLIGCCTHSRTRPIGSTPGRLAPTSLHSWTCSRAEGPTSCCHPITISRQESM